MSEYNLTRRKLTELAQGAGLEPDSKGEYPDQILPIVQNYVSNRRGKRKSVSQAAADQAETTTINIAQEDLQAIQCAAEQRAAAITVGLNALTMHHVATGKFSDPQLQAIVDESKNNLRVALAGIGAAYQITDFLAATPLLQIAGGNGSRNLLTGSETSAESSDAELLTA